MDNKKLLLVFLAAAGVFYSLIAVFYPLVGDEQFHAYFARWTAERLELPLNVRVNPSLWYFYPPLYVVLAGFFVKLFSGLLSVVQSARIFSVLATLAAAALVFKFVEKRLPQADKKILLLFLFASPFVSSNAGLATITPLGLLTGLAVVYLFYEFLDKPSSKNTVLLGVALAAALYTHFYMLPVPAIVVALGFLNRTKVDWRKLLAALALGVALIAPFYLHNLLNYGHINGPAGAEQQTFSGGKLIASFNPGCLYVDPWLSGLNAFAHFDDLFVRLDSLVGLPVSSKLFWSVSVAFLYLLILIGFVALTKQKLDYTAISLLSLPPVYYGDCFIRYAGVLPLFLGIFLAVGVNSVPTGEKTKKIVKIIAAIIFAAFVIQTLLTIQGVRVAKVPIYSFMQALPQQIEVSELCYLGLPGEPVAPLPSVLLNREVPPCRESGFKQHVLVLKDLPTHPRGYAAEDLAKLESEYVVVSSERGGTNEAVLYSRK